MRNRVVKVVTIAMMIVNSALSFSNEVEEKLIRYIPLSSISNVETSNSTCHWQDTVKVNGWKDSRKYPHFENFLNFDILDEELIYLVHWQVGGYSPDGKENDVWYINWIEENCVTFNLQGEIISNTFSSTLNAMIQNKDGYFTDVLNSELCFKVKGVEVYESPKPVPYVTTFSHPTVRLKLRKENVSCSNISEDVVSIPETFFFDGGKLVDYSDKKIMNYLYKYFYGERYRPSPNY